MKKIIIGILMVACGVLISSQSTFAHVLVTDETKTKGAILHIIPDDDPVAGEEATLYFDTQEQLSDAKVELTIENAFGDATKVETSKDGSLVTAKYTFPVQGVYSVAFTLVSDDARYVFNQSQRVSRGLSTSTLTQPSYAWAEVLLLASGICFAVLIIIATNRRKDIAKHSTF